MNPKSVVVVIPVKNEVAPLVQRVMDNLPEATAMYVLDAEHSDEFIEAVVAVSLDANDIDAIESAGDVIDLKEHRN